MTATSAAVIIGVDAYEARPLTSCVNDATAFRQVLLDLNLVDEASITLLTSPLTNESSGPADGNSIRDALRVLYRRGHDLERVYIYFAGHGLLGQKTGSVQAMRTVLVPADVVDFADEGNKMIDLDELHDYLRLVGPKEQFYFIDACRNLDYSVSPMVGPLGWGPEPPRRPRAQRTLYAVAELGEAGAIRGEGGFMTKALIDALHGKGSAVDYDSSADEYQITAESVRTYVQRRIQELIDDDPQGMAGITIPQLLGGDPSPSPIRLIPYPPDVPLLIHVRPDSADGQTWVTVSYNGVVLPDARWPPVLNHDSAMLRPQWYRIDSKSTLGPTSPRRRTIDVREESEAEIWVGDPSPERHDDSQPAPALVETRGGTAPTSTQTGRVVAQALDSVVTVEVIQRQPPYAMHRGVGQLEVELPIGTYQVRFRLGGDVYSAHDISVGPDETVRVDAQVQPSPIMRDVLGLADQPLTDAVLSESIGPIQSGMVETMLPIIGLKPFDVEHQVFSPFDHYFPTRVSPDDVGGCAVSVVIGVDDTTGNHWPDPAAALNDLVIDAGGVPLQPQLLPSAEGRPDRLAVAINPRPPGPFMISVSGPALGRIDAPAVALDGRVTVLAVRFRPSGPEVTQNILRFPARDYPDEPVSHLPYGRVLRDLQLGMQLYNSDELISNAATEVLQSLLYAKWTDPLLGCMAAYSLWDTGDPSNRWPAQEAALNLVRYFPDLPDSQTVLALTHPAQQEATFRLVLETEQIPVLARSVRQLAAFADNNDLTGTWAQELARRIRPRQPWSLTARAPALTPVSAEAMMSF